MKAVTERLYDVFKPVIEELGLSLVDVEWVPARGGRRLGVYIARKEGSVTLEDCTLVTRALDLTLEEDPELTEAYILEVSSPGLDRVIKRDEEYEIFTGRNIAIRLNEPLNDQLELEGRLQGVKDGIVEVAVPSNVIEIPVRQIQKAKLVFKFK